MKSFWNFKSIKENGSYSEMFGMWHQLVQSVAKAQPGEMCIQCAKVQGLRLPSIHERNQGQPRQNQRRSTHEASAV
jgi:hypothetical protein